MMNKLSLSVLVGLVTTVLPCLGVDVRGNFRAGVMLARWTHL